MATGYISLALECLNQRTEMANEYLVLTHKGERRAALLKHRIKEHAESAGKLDVVACVTKPGRT